MTVNLGGRLRNFRVDRGGTRHVSRAFGVLLERIRIERFRLHGHVLVIELQRVLLVNCIVTPWPCYGRYPRLRRAFSKRQENRGSR